MEACKGELTFLPTQDYLYQILQPEFPKFCKNSSKRCQAFGTTIYLIFQLARYMGFSEIYMLGTDCSYTGTDNKFHAYNDSNDAILYGNARRSASLERALFRGFNAIALYCQHDKSIKVYNATRGGKLELFPRVDLDELLGDRKE